MRHFQSLVGRVLPGRGPPYSVTGLTKLINRGVQRPLLTSGLFRSREIRDRSPPAGGGGRRSDLVQSAK